MTENVTWAAARLHALRVAAGLTQAALAKRAGIGRERLNRIENSAYPLTDYYAGRLAPHLGVSPGELLPPTGDEADPEDPLVLLLRLSGTVDDLETANEALEDRVAKLERAVSDLRRAQKAA